MNPDNAAEIITFAKSPNKTVLRRIADGDKHAVRECVAKHGDTIWRLARHYTDSETDAETVTLEIFRELWKCAASFDPERCAEEIFIRRIAYRSLFKTRESP